MQPFQVLYIYMKLECSPVLHSSLVHQPERLVQVVVVQDLSHEQLVIVSENLVIVSEQLVIDEQLVIVSGHFFVGGGRTCNWGRLMRRRVRVCRERRSMSVRSIT